MIPHKNTLHRLGAAFAMLLLTGCSLNLANAAPTPDINAIRAEVVQTVMAGVALTQAAQPTATVPKPTLTQTATAAKITLSTPTALLLLTPLATSTTAYTGGGSVVQPTVNTYVDQAKVTYQSIKDATVMKPGLDFDVRWGIKNTGRRDWTNEFYYKLNGGKLVPVHSTGFGYLPALPVGSETTIVMDFVAPHEPGTYTAYIMLVNNDAVDFYHFYVTIVVR